MNREVFAVSSTINRKRTNIVCVCGKKSRILNAKLGGTQKKTPHWA